MTRKTDKSEQKTTYTSEAWTKAQDYRNRVESGQQIANQWIKKAIQRSRKDEKRSDIFLKKEAVLRAFEFFYFARISTGEGYKRFSFTPYQAWLIFEIFGWYLTARPTKRRYRYAILYTARKSGKTVFFVLVEMLVLMYEHQESPEAYLCATTREQAGQALKYSKAIIKNSPALKKRLKSQQFRILYPKRDGILKVLANKPDKNDSLSPSIFIMDEMHAHPTLDFFNVMKSGTLFRKNPLGIITSTAGFNKEYPFYMMIQTAEKMLDEVITDDITFAALYTLDPEDDPNDFTVWEKSNPNINYTVELPDLIAEYKKAKLTISEFNNFLTKNLNLYLDNLDKWIPDSQYQTCFNNIPLPKQKVPAYIGVDMSATRDIASMVIVWTDPETGKIAVLPEFYFPQNEEKKIRASGIDLGAWIEKGYIIEHPTKSIDQELIFERFQYYNQIFEIEMVFYDKWNTGWIIPKLESDLYLYCKHFEQKTTWFNFPLKFIEKLFFDEGIAMSENPVLRWMFSNIVLYYDGNGNIKIMKNKSKDSVDGPVAFAMAVGAWLQNNGDITASVFRELIDATKPKEQD